MSGKKRGPVPGVKETHYFLMALLGLALFGCFTLLKPYLGAIILAIIFAMIFHPIHAWIEKHLKNRKNLAASISCLILMTVFLLPLLLVSAAAIQQGIRSVAAITEWLAQGGLETIMQKPFMASFIELAKNHINSLHAYFPDLKFENLDIPAKLMGLSSWMLGFLTNNAASILKNVTMMMGEFLLMIFVFFFIIRDYDEIIDGILHLSPLSSSQENRILARIKDVSKSAILGTVATSATQGLLGGIGLALCGLPGLFWGGIMAFTSLIPVAGNAVIWIPAAIYLFLSGRTFAGIFLSVWSILIVGLSDNITRPLFMKGGADMSTLMILLSILGGLNLFGMIGMLYGPLIFGIAMVLLYIYETEFGNYLDSQDRA